MKTSVQRDVQCEDFTFFTAFSPWARAELCLRPQVREENWGTLVLRMIRTDAEVGEQQWLSAGVLAPAQRPGNIVNNGNPALTQFGSKKEIQDLAPSSSQAPNEKAGQDQEDYERDVNAARSVELCIQKWERIVYP